MMFHMLELHLRTNNPSFLRSNLQHGNGELTSIARMGVLRRNSQILRYDLIARSSLAASFLYNLIALFERI